MKYLILFLLLMPFVLAEEKGINADIKNITIKTWVQDNESMCEVYFETKDVYYNRVFNQKVNSSENYTLDEFEIRFTKNLECNTTVEEMMLEYFTECNNITCKEAYTSCKSEINTYKSIKNENINHTEAYISCLNNKNTLDFEKSNLDIKYANCTGILKTETEKREKAESSKTWYFFIGMLIVWGWYNYKEKGGRTKEERDMGVVGKTGGVFDYFKDLLQMGPKKKESVEIEEKKEPLRI